MQCHNNIPTINPLKQHYKIKTLGTVLSEIDNKECDTPHITVRWQPL